MKQIEDLLDPLTGHIKVLPTGKQTFTQPCFTAESDPGCVKTRPMI